jgi:hypothetical protein
MLLKGRDGLQGPPGEPGTPGLTVVGEKGQKGEPGIPGLSIKAGIQFQGPKYNITSAIKGEKGDNVCLRINKEDLKLFNFNFKLCRE